ncbi:MAG TPA: hypothetical protein VFT78_02470 [Hanamia sp.]|nr:hypothetical protein [Hanamia sp.]
MKNDVIYSDYSDEFKKELKKRVNYYLEGGKMIDPNEINQRIAAIKRKRKK